MNEQVKQALKNCPRCKKDYIGYPAISRDNKTKVCSGCGIEEAQFAFREWQKRTNPLQMWKELHRKARFYNMALKPFNSGFTVEYDGDLLYYHSNCVGMRQAITDIEYLANL